jgi:VCBS repeat protein
MTMLSHSKQMPLLDPALERRFSRHARRHVLLPASMLLLLAASCGQRYQIGDVIQPLDQVGAEETTELIATLVADGRDDVDVRVGVGVQSSTGMHENPIGDVDGDGHDDWITETFQLVYGGPRVAGDTFPEPGAALTTFSFGPGAEPSPSDASSHNVSSVVPQAAGDVDGDGYADILFESWRTGGGTPAAAEHWASQRAYLWYGRAERPVGEVRLQDEGVAFAPAHAFDPAQVLGDELLSAEAVGNVRQWMDLAAVGDLDGDGFDDFTYSYFANILGGRSGSPYIDSVTLIYYGGTERLPTTGATELSAAQLSGIRQAQAVGDLDGDGFDDLLAAQNDGGSSIILPGGAQRLSAQTSPSTLRLPSELGPLSELRSAGDLDRDGMDDLIITEVDGEDSAAFLFYGSPRWATTAIDRDLADATFVFEKGRAELLQAGDWNGDGSNDLILRQQVRRGDEIVDPFGREAEWRGEVRVIPGQAQRYTGDYVTTLIHPELPARDQIQFNGAFDVYPVGDIDGDGFADVQVLMETAVPTQPRTLEAFIKYGGPLDAPAIY